MLAHELDQKLVLEARDDVLLALLKRAAACRNLRFDRRAIQVDLELAKDPASFAGHERAFERVAQLTHVAGKPMLTESHQAGTIDGAWLQNAELTQDRFAKERQILSSRSERRQGNGQDLQTIIEILA